MSVPDNFVFFLLCLVHCDIKPHNILLFIHNGLKAKLSDCGLSKNSIHSGGTGSLGWMAPEVESGQLVCQSCGLDIYEIGSYRNYYCNWFLFNL